MNQRAAFFEISSITLLVLIGMTLSSLSIDSTGILSVAALLSLFCASSHYKTVLGFVLQLSTKQAWLPASITSKSES